MSDEILYILKKLDSDLNDHSKQDDGNFKEISNEMKEQTSVLRDIRGDLNDHMEGNIQNRASIKEVRLRVVALEEPKKARKYIREFLIDTSKLTGAILALAAFWKYLGPYIFPSH